MSTVKMILEDEATGRVKEIYDEIMESLGIDFVPIVRGWIAWRATGNPANHRLFIDFTIWANAAQGLVMLIATPV